MHLLAGRIDHPDGTGALGRIRSDAQLRFEGWERDGGLVAQIATDGEPRSVTEETADRHPVRVEGRVR